MKAATRLVFASALTMLSMAPPAESAGVRDVPPTVSPEAAAVLQRMFSPDRPFPAMATPRTLEEWDARRAAVEKLVAPMFAPLLERLAPKVVDDTLGGVPVLRVTVREPRRGAPVLVYVHGGGYTMLSARSSLASAAAMADATGLEVISVDWTVAPRGTWRTATDEVVAVYRALVRQGHRPRSIGVFGDSAGGALAAGSVLKLRDQRVDLPGALVLWSPWSDITAAGDTYATLADADPLLKFADLEAGAAAYADPADQKHPYVSPVYGDYAPGYPPTLIQGGTREIFLSNFVRHYQAIASAGGIAVLDLYEGMPHVHQVIVPDSPEARTALARGAQFFRTHLQAR